MYTFHRMESRSTEVKMSQVSGLLEASQGVSSLAAEMDRFRSASSDLKTLSVAEGKVALEKIQARTVKTLSQINRANLEERERKELDAIQGKLDALFQLCNKVMSSYNSADPFRLAETREAHADLSRQVTQLGASLQSRSGVAVSSIKGVATTNIRIFVIGGGVILLLLLCVYARDYFAFQRPIKALDAFAAQTEVGKAPTATQGASLSGPYGRVAQVLATLSGTLERQGKERHKFLLDLLADFSVPLSMLSAGKTLINPKTAASASEAGQAQAADTVRRGIAALSGSLEDLGDLAEFGNLANRLDERLVDLSELVLNVSRSLAPSATHKWITTTLPSMPVWAKLDPRRFERVLTHAILKVAATLAHDEKLHVSIAEAAEQGEQGYSGVELLIQGSARQQSRSSTGSGPKVEITKHWLNEKGLFLGVMNRIIRVHGGEITASGVSGTSAQVRIRLPKERVVHGLINAPTGLQVNLEPGAAEGDAAARNGRPG
jgi:signal transduction histidine kinase